ncbi:MAG: DUF4140 domain-containing protein [Kofleriaceae bacterium]
MSEVVERALVAPVVEVAVLEDRARVTRRGRLAIGAGFARLVVPAVAPVLVDKTLTAVAEGGARVLDVRCRRRLAPWHTGEAGADAERGQVASALAEEVAAARRALAAGDAAVAALTQELTDLDAVRQLALAELAADAAWGRAPLDAGARLDALAAAEQALVARRIDAAWELSRERAALARAEARPAEAADGRGRRGEIDVGA